MLSSLSEILSAYKPFIDTLVSFFAATWWFWLFMVLYPLFKNLWLFWKQELFRRSSRYTILDIQIPREIMKDPKGMDQVLQAMSNLGNRAGNFKEKYMDGEVPRPLTLEITSFGGEVHLSIRFYNKLKPLIEAAIQAYYPDVELVEVDDHINDLPVSYADMRAKGMEIFGTDMVLNKPGAYPTRTYQDFASLAEASQYDPFATFLEVLSKLKKEEFVGIQINMIPSSWPKSSYKELEALKTPTKIKEKGVEVVVPKTARQLKVIEAVENNLSKTVFDSTIRFIYIAPKTIFYDSLARRGVLGAFNQYQATDLNSFRPNWPTMSLTSIWVKPYIFPALRAIIRKQRLILYYRKREVPDENPIGRILSDHPFGFYKVASSQINSEVLASIFHPPTNLVLTAPHIKRTPSRKVGPSAGLPIYGDEKEIERFK